MAAVNIGCVRKNVLLVYIQCTVAFYNKILMPIISQCLTRILVVAVNNDGDLYWLCRL